MVLPSIIVLATVELTVQITVYSFCLVHFLHVIFSGYIREYIRCIVFHARMIDVADIKQTLWHAYPYPTAKLLITPYQHSRNININLADILLVIFLPLQYQHLLAAIFHTMPTILDILFLVHILHHN